MHTEAFEADQSVVEGLVNVLEGPKCAELENCHLGFGYVPREGHAAKGKESIATVALFVGCRMLHVETASIYDSRSWNRAAVQRFYPHLECKGEPKEMARVLRRVLEKTPRNDRILFLKFEGWSVALVLPRPFLSVPEVPVLQPA